MKLMAGERGDRSSQFHSSEQTSTSACSNNYRMMIGRGERMGARKIRTGPNDLRYRLIEGEGRMTPQEVRGLWIGITAASAVAQMVAQCCTIWIIAK